jgi:hypothetical protein
LHAPDGQVAAPWSGEAQGAQDDPHEAGLLFGRHSAPQAWKPLWQVNAQALASPQVASALAGAVQALQAVPQLLTAVSGTQSSPQSWVPAGHWPSHALPGARQLPVLLQRVVPAGQVFTQLPALQSAPPPTAGVQGVHEAPHDSGLSSALQSSPQRW